MRLSLNLKGPVLRFFAAVLLGVALWFTVSYRARRVAFVVVGAGAVAAAWPTVRRALKNTW